jgi:hypothetical protein
MTTPTSRFADLTRWQAQLIVLLTLLVVAGGFIFRMHNKYLPGAELGPPVVKALSNGAKSTIAASPHVTGDFELYANIIQRMEAGAGYYPTAADEHRKTGFPLRPFITVRLPTLAVISATVGLTALRGLLFLLVGLTVLIWWHRLKQTAAPESLEAVISTMLVGTGLIAYVSSAEVVVSHEIWAGALLALSWGLHLPKADSVKAPAALIEWLPSVLLATAAVLIRELALPFILLMGAFAVWRRQWLQASAWVAAVGMFAVYMAFHAANVAGVVNPTDMASPGWGNLAGWPFFVLSMHGATSLRIMPEWVAPLIVPITMLGWIGWRSATGAFGCLLFSGYALLFGILGRPDNWYWGLLIAPMFVLGLLHLPRSLSDLAHLIWPKTVPPLHQFGKPA